MGLFSRARTFEAPDRRQARRYRVDSSAKLIMPSGNRTGRLFDLSEDGARVRTDDAPPKGCSAILEWDGHEAYAHVIWSNHESCGLRFDRPLPRKIVHACAGMETEEPAPLHNGSQSHFGQRRPVS